MMHEYNGNPFSTTPLSLAVKGVLLLGLLLLLSALPTQAQEFRVQGVVISATDDAPLPGVNLVEVGTTNGTTTDADGTFELTVSGPDAALATSFVGFAEQTVELDGRGELTIALEEDVEALDEVVVTAFGIEKKERALGYSVGEVDGESLREVREINVANALAGKVAGVQVSKPATGPAGSSRVIIRGVTSLGAGDDNQPLYVVDGVPIDNSNLGAAGMWGGSDGGDGISSINPDDIEEVSVLKGAAAAALYGTRAKNGVVLITTKTAQLGGGLGVEFNSNLTFEDVLVSTDWQTVYGQGSRGERPTTADEARTTNLSAWGDELDGQPSVQWDGTERPYALVDDRVGRFYNTGLTATNSLALTTSTEQASVRLSASHLSNEGITPNSGLSRTTFSLRGTANFGSRLSADAKLNFVHEDVQNRPRLSDSPGNANYTVYMLAPNVSPEPMVGTQERPGTNEDNEELAVTGSIFSQNPYFAAHNITEADEDRRLIGVASLRYEFTDWLALQGRFGGDTYTTRRSSITPFGTGYNPLGTQSEQEFRITEINTDFLFLADGQLTPTIGASFDFGGNLLYREDERLTLAGSGGFNIPDLEVVTNQANPRTGYGFSEKQINSLYGRAEFSYDEVLYLTVTGRNDWSSTLPAENNAYFYPSLSASFVFSDAFTVPSWLSFGKVRASVAQVGGDTDPYQLALTYALAGATHLGRPYGSVAQGAVPLANLKPTSTTETELGFNVRFLDDRLGADFTWYDKTTEDQILATTISNASGFGSQIINAGEIRNAGIELLLTTTPVRARNLRWSLDLNLARNRNEVVSLNGEQESLILAESRRRGNFVTADVGEPYGSIKGQKYLLDDQGRRVFDAEGLPLAAGEISVLGNGTPSFIGGVASTLRFRRFTLNALVDMSFGGEIFSALNSYAYGSGLHQETLKGREEGFILGQGVAITTCAKDEEDEYIRPLTGCSANTVQADPQDYYGRIASDIGEVFVYGASFVKLRELQLSYRLPTRFLTRTPIQVATLSLVGRNLWLIHSNVPNLDPESSFRSDSQGIGLEHSGVPQTRSLGFNLTVRL